MMPQGRPCPYGHQTAIVRHGQSPEGQQRYCCWPCLAGRGRPFLLEYAYAGQSPVIQQQSGDRARQARGRRDRARGGRVSPTTVIKELNKKSLHTSQ